MIKQIVPYLYAISTNTTMVIMNIFMKMIVLVIPSVQALYVRSFLCLLINSYFLYFTKEKSKLNLNQHKQLHKSCSTQTTSKIQQKKSHTSMHNLHIDNKEDFITMLKHNLFNCFTTWLITLSFQLLPLGISTAFFNTTPIFAFFIQAILFKKPILKVHLGLTLLCFIGALLIINPFKEKEIKQNAQHHHQVNLYYVIIPTLAAISSCISNIYLHELRGKIPNIISLEYRYIFNVIYFSVLMCSILGKSQVLINSSQVYFTSSLLDPYFIGAFIMVIVLSYLSNYLGVKTISLLSPSQIFSWNYLGVVLSIAFDIIIFDYEIKYTQIIGILLVNVGILSKIVFTVVEIKQKQTNSKHKAN